ncbi:GNAT family N-acetyltransferase [Acuticoccus sp.]|uniref:GNAT family N-acetyltransferase n=1 Tax=Acuticoccus sp. TaxID=1904378 RepID=UPI003B52B9B4
MRIIVDDLSGPQIAGLLMAHAQLMEAITPRERFCHYLPLDGLRRPDVTVWSAWDDDTLVGCGALRALGDGHGEIKSMHTLKARRGGGVGTAILATILAEARGRGYRRVSLETGDWDEFRAVRAFYERHGFVRGEAFGDYVGTPASAYYTMELAPEAA